MVRQYLLKLGDEPVETGQIARVELKGCGFLSALLKLSHHVLSLLRFAVCRSE